MGQDVEGMGPGERAICLTLFVCLAVAVFTTVALIYLTSIVYLPVKYEMEAGFEAEPVMCTSIESNQVYNSHLTRDLLTFMTRAHNTNRLTHVILFYEGRCIQVDCGSKWLSCFEWCISDAGDT